MNASSGSSNKGQDAFDKQVSSSLVAALRQEAETSDQWKKKRLLDEAAKLEARMKSRLVERWQGLFSLWKHEDGKFRVDLEPELEELKRLMMIGLDSQDQEVAVVYEGFTALLYVGITLKKRDRAFSPVEAKIVFETLQGTLAPRILRLQEGTEEERQCAAKELKKEICTVIDRFSSADPRQLLHGNKLLIGKNHKQSVPELLITGARALVEKHHRLPTKHEVRNWFEQQKYGTRMSARVWPQHFKAAGLSSLPSKVPYQ